MKRKFLSKLFIAAVLAMPVICLAGCSDLDEILYDAEDSYDLDSLRKGELETSGYGLKKSSDGDKVGERITEETTAEPTTERAAEPVTEIIIVEAPKAPDYNSSIPGSTAPFYGVWCGAFKQESNAWKTVNDLIDKGYDARMFVSTDWSNLNSEKWYVVTAGVYETKSAADSVLPRVEAAGYTSAYVKYSGYRYN